ncbi:dehydratase [Lithospermum erythrorhizon]|uniref:Carbonic anhydrase n=1 Tax=Lithospermum erythrorhizon TaxID=34254 RepID=A0AAV3Q495_LITER
MESRIVFIYIVATSLLIVSTFGYLEKGIIDAQFGYTGPVAPDRWGTLSPNFSTCSHGKLQSPINILKHKASVNKDLKPLAEQLSSCNASLVNNGFNVGLRYPNNSGHLSINGKNYTLKQMHWHAPSEHRLNGVQYAAELHLVHIAEDNSVSVVAILYRLGKPDPLLAKIQNWLIELAKDVDKGDPKAEIALGPGAVDIHQLKKHAKKYYRYAGSFTTPPCTESVIWNILGKVRSVSKEQVEDLRAPLSLTCKKNARPCQPLNGRKVELYKELRTTHSHK